MRYLLHRYGKRRLGLVISLLGVIGSILAWLLQLIALETAFVAVLVFYLVMWFVSAYERH